MFSCPRLAPEAGFAPGLCSMNLWSVCVHLSVTPLPAGQFALWSHFSHGSMESCWFFSLSEFSTHSKLNWLWGWHVGGQQTNTALVWKALTVIHDLAERIAAVKTQNQLERALGTYQKRRVSWKLCQVSVLNRTLNSSLQWTLGIC